MTAPPIRRAHSRSGPRDSLEHRLSGTYVTVQCPTSACTGGGSFSSLYFYLLGPVTIFYVLSLSKSLPFFWNMEVVSL